MLEQAKGYILMTMIVVAFGLGWKVHTWKDGFDQAESYKSSMSDLSNKLTIFSKDQKATSDEGIVVSGKLDVLSTRALAIQKEIPNVTLANKAATGCSNPFTLDFVRLLNGDDPGSSIPSPGAATVSGPSQVSGP